MSLLSPEVSITPRLPKSYNNSTSGSDLLQELVKDPLNLLYRFYQATSAFATDLEDEGTRPPSQDTTAAGSRKPDEKAHLQRRLHPKAESCRSSLMAGTASIELKRMGDDGNKSKLPELIDLPVSVLLHIATFMDAKSLCHLQQSCKHFHSLMSDELLWRRKLAEDSHKWPVMSHLSHPRVYEETAADKTAQEIYSSCYQNRDSAPTQSFSNPVTHTLRYIMRRIQGRVPRLLMLGSGLESVPLIRLMIMENNSPYKPTGLFPGKDGVGAGICVKHKDTSINLVTLYTATKAERIAGSTGQGKRINKLISAYNEDDKDAPELTRAVQEQCQLADGFILIVNASKLDQEALNLDTTMINAMLRSGSPKNALLVLSCHLQREGDKPNSGFPANDSSLEIADKLKLCDISCPWQVRNLDVSTFRGLSDGFDWLLAATDNN